MAGPSWEYLPSVIIVEILSYLSTKDRLKAASSCRRWRNLLFQPSLWPAVVLDLHGHKREKVRFLTDVCGRFVRECVVKFNSHEQAEVVECFRILQYLAENKNLQVLQVETSSCHIEWSENLTPNRFVQKLEEIVCGSRKLKHFSVGCSEELLEHSGSLLDSLSHRHGQSLQALHLASVKEDSENYGIVDLDVTQFRRFSQLKHLSLDYDFLDNLTLQILTENGRAPLQSLVIHIHGVDPEHDKITNATWRHLVSRHKSLEVTINLVHSYVGVSSLLDILQPCMPLAHFRQFFCLHMNLPALGLMASQYGRTLRSVHVVDGFENNSPVVYDSVGMEEDPFVMLAWKCLHLHNLTLIGYEVSDYDVVAMARLRGSGLRELHIPNSCIRWLPEGEETEVVGGIAPDFTSMMSTSLALGRAWRPLEDNELPDAVFDDWADAERAYNHILAQDQAFRPTLKPRAPNMDCPT